MRIVKGSLSIVLFTMPLGVGWAVFSRCTRDGSGVAPGANSLCDGVCERLGEKERAVGGLLEMVDVAKRLLAPEKLLFRLLVGTSSRVNNVFRDAPPGVPRRFGAVL